MNWQKVIALEKLSDTGLAHRFKVLEEGEMKPALVMLFQGKVLAYLNRCPHLGVELDWAPGQVFDELGQYLVCSTHGAFFQPQSGLCISGPCQGASLTPLAVRVQNGTVYCALGEGKA